MAVNPSVTPGAKKPTEATQANQNAQQRFAKATQATQAPQTAQQQLNNAWAQQAANKSMTDAAQKINTAMQGRQTKATGATATQTVQPTAQQKQNASTTQEAKGGIYQVQPNGQAPKGLKVGDQVVTGGGTYTITGVNADGTYTSKLTNADQKTSNYTGQYSQVGGTTSQPSQPQRTQGYDPNVDYEAELAKAVAAGDLEAAAIIENARNTKIDAMGLGDKYGKTYQFAAYLNGADPTRAAQLISGYTTAPIKFPEVNGGSYRDILEQWRQSSIDQQNAQIDYATQLGITEAQRAEADAQPEFDKRLKQLDSDTARAMANSAFYAEARGDRGGIGQSQYNEVQAQALANKQAIQAERTKLATDTARTIADLRAKGEFEKADALLTANQEHLARLFELEQWLVNVGMSKAEFDQAKQQADLQHQLQVANITGEFDGQPTWSARKYDQETAAGIVNSLINAGLQPGEDLLKAAGLDAYSSDIARLVSQMSVASYGSGGGSDYRYYSADTGDNGDSGDRSTAADALAKGSQAGIDAALAAALAEAQKKNPPTNPKPGNAYEM